MKSVGGNISSKVPPTFFLDKEEKMNYSSFKKKMSLKNTYTTNLISKL